MQEITVEIHTSGKSEVDLTKYNEIYKNDKGYSVYERENTKRLEVFNEDKNSSNRKLEDVIIIDWLKDKYFAKIMFVLCTEQDEDKALKKMKKFIQNYFDKNYAFIGSINYDAIVLPKSE